MAPRIVHRLTQPPHKCIVSGFSDGPFLDTGVESPYIEPWVAFNVQVLKDLAREVGMVPEEDLAAANETIADLEHRVHQLDLQIQEQDSYLDGIDGLTKAGYMVRKAPGRPKKKVA